MGAATLAISPCLIRKLSLAGTTRSSSSNSPDSICRRAISVRLRLRPDTAAVPSPMYAHAPMGAMSGSAILGTGSGSGSGNEPERERDRGRAHLRKHHPRALHRRDKSRSSRARTREREREPYNWGVSVTPLGMLDAEWGGTCPYASRCSPHSNSHANARANINASANLNNPRANPTRHDSFSSNTDGADEAVAARAPLDKLPTAHDNGLLRLALSESSKSSALLYK
ncbi:hypothetical protein MSAN_00677800 [Mycena sanguinolenta]|uniref:Uncharacterized protein n=1 Tax=Mycena sanguinolenta TaxID=230812 RepID=A0A8H6Z748_9AGAR|nr:hypothetical protein MSAN_00677800 [Mycena sanguinolenta]